MRKQLMAGTALVAAAMLVAGGAAAQDKKMMKLLITVNGSGDYVVGGVLNEEQKRGGVDAANDTSALDVRVDAEVHFNGRAQTDNGLKFHMRVELEGQDSTHPFSSTDEIDEYFLSVSGSFGQIILGGTGGAPVKMLTGLTGSWATGVGESLTYNSNSWVPSATGGGGKVFHTINNARFQDHDADKVTYISPKFAGLQVGVSYSPDNANNGLNDRVRADTTTPGTTPRTTGFNGLEGAVSYTGKCGDVGFGVGAAMSAYEGATDGSSDDQSDWAVAARIDFGGGFRLAGGFKRTTDDNEAAQGQVTDLGARFVTGANSFSLVGSMGEMDESGAQYTAVMASYARGLGAGAKWHANVIWNDSDNGMSGADENANTGTALVTGITVRF